MHLTADPGRSPGSVSFQQTARTVPASKAARDRAAALRKALNPPSHPHPDRRAEQNGYWGLMASGTDPLRHCWRQKWKERPPRPSSAPRRSAMERLEQGVRRLRSSSTLSAFASQPTLCPSGLNAKMKIASHVGSFHHSRPCSP